MIDAAQAPTMERSSNSRSDSPPSPLEWLVVAVILLVTALLRWRLFTVPLERDEGEYAYMGQLILRGEIPYVAAYNMKLPGVYYANAAILAVFGETAVGVRTGLLLINLGAIVLLYLVGRRLFDATAGLSAAAAYAALSLSPSVTGFSAKAEHFVVLFMLAGVLMLLRAGRTHRLLYIAGAGLLLGIAVLMKQHGAAFVVFGGLYLLRTAWRQRRAAPWSSALGELTVLGLMSLIPFALTCAGMLAVGAFAPFWFWTFSYASTYAVMLPLSTGLHALAGNGLRIVIAALGLWSLALAGIAAPWWNKRLRSEAATLGLLTLCSFLSICPGFRFSPHYFILLLPAASLWIGVALSGLRDVLATDRSHTAAVAVGGVLLVALAAMAIAQRHMFLLAPPDISRVVFGLNPFPEAIEIARYLRQHTRPGDRVAVIGSEPEIYFYAQARAATGYIYMYPLMEGHAFSQHMQEDMIAQITRAQPRFLILVNVDTSWSKQPNSARTVEHWIDSAVNDEYEPVGLAEIFPDQPTTYRWGDEVRHAQLRSPLYIVTFAKRST